MAHTVGGVVPSKIIVGTTPVTKVMVGSTQVWPDAPPALASPIPVVKGVPTAATGTTVALPAHNVGDLIVVFAQNHNTLSAVAPPIPAAGGTVPAWTTLYKNASSDGVPVHVAWVIATATDHTCGTWTGANGVSAVVVTNVHQTTPIGSSGGVKSISIAGSSPVIPALQEPGYSAILCYYAVATSSGAFGDPPAGYTKHFSDARLCINSALDTTSYKPVPMPHTSGQSLTWRDVAFEVKFQPPPGLWAVDVEYLANYEVRFTARTTYATSAQDSFFFSGPPTVSGFNGFVGRTFTRQWASGAAITCTLEDSYGAGGPLNTITITVTPKATAADAAVTVAAAGAIKGNADSGLYHMPTDPHYDETIAEAWFTTEAEAKAAGFIKYTKRRKKS